MKYIKWILLLIMFKLLQNCAAFGENPNKNYLEIIQKSKNFDLEKNEFINREPKVIDEMHKRSLSFKGIKEYLFGGGDFRKPKESLPEIKPNLDEFLEKSENIKFIWFGHSTFLVHIEGKILLFDPVFSGSAAPFSTMVKRFQKIVISLEELPEIDYILISHDHYDHLDYETMLFFKNKKTKFITGLGVGSHLRYWGIEENRIEELDWWEKSKYSDLDIYFTPAQHFSGRKGFDGNKTLWGSYVVKGKKQNFYFSGDSGYDVHFKNIGEKFGPFDLSFIENGQYDELWKEVHILPEETVIAYKDLKSKALVPVHWGMFDLALHNWFDPMERLEKASEGKNINLYTPKFGQIVEINKQTIFEKWWKKYIPFNRS